MSQTRFSATMIHGRLLRLAVLTAAVLSLMAVMSPPPALADSDQRCSQRGNFSGGNNDIKCVFDNGTKWAEFTTTISRLLIVNVEKNEVEILNKAVVNVLSNNTGCNGLVVVLSCNKAIADVVKITLISLGNIKILAPIKVVVGSCGCPRLP
jgi:hypothetical protein